MINSTPQTPSHSRCATLNDCERKYYYSYILELEPADREESESPPMKAGKLLHYGLDVLYRQGFGSIDAAVSAMEERWNDFISLGKYEYMTLGHLEVILRNYVDHWHDSDPFEPLRLRYDDPDTTHLLAWDAEVDSQGHLKLAEAAFAVDLGDCSVLIKPDLAVQSSSGLAVVDHKSTTGYLGQRLYNRVKYKHQLRIYALGLSQLLGKPVRTGICNALYTGEYASRSNSKATLFDRYTFDWSPAQLAETRGWVKRSSSRMVQLESNRDSEAQWLQNPGMGCSWCDFAPLCEASPRIRPHKIKQEYREKQRDEQLLKEALT